MMKIKSIFFLKKVSCMGQFSIHFIETPRLMVTYFLIFIFTLLHHTFWVHNFSLSYMKNVLSPFSKVHYESIYNWSLPQLELHALGHHHSLPRQMEIVHGGPIFTAFACLQVRWHWKPQVPLAYLLEPSRSKFPY
jgi:hypothetical protein